MLVFHVDLVVLIADQEQEAIGVLGADAVALPQTVEGQNDRVCHVDAVAQLGVGGFNADHHVRKTQQRSLDRLLKYIGADGLGHLDGVARYACAVVRGTVQENFAVAVGTQIGMLDHIF